MAWGGGFGPDLLPTPANADDDEFNGLTLSSAWQLLGATVQAGDPQRGVTIVGPNVVRQSLSVRSGWFMFQPDVGAYYSKLLATSLTTGMVYAKFSMDSNAGVGPDAFALLLGQSTAGNLDIDNAVSVSLGRAVGSNTWTLKAEKRVAAVSTTVYTATLDSFVQPFDRMQIYRNGTTFAFLWVRRRADSRRWDLRRLRSRPTGWRLVALPPVDPRRSLGWTTCAGSMASIPPSSHTPG